MIGITDLTFSRGSGSFHCPGCMQTRPYQRKMVRQFLTVYFIPLIPLQQVGQYIQCEHCKTKHDPTLADMDAEAIAKMQHQRIHELIRRALVLIVAADDVVTDEELETVQSFSLKFLEIDFSTHQILAEAARVHEHSLDAIDYIRSIAPELDPEDKHLLVLHAFLAASASGDLSDSRQQLLTQLPEAVGVPESEYRAIIQRAIES